MKYNSIHLHFRFLFLLFLFALVVFFSSCTQNLPDVNYTSYSLVFSFENEEVQPTARLSIFMDNDSDVRRCERIKVFSRESDYIWETANIKKIAAGDYQWAGNVNFVVPAGEKMPLGKYEITYINADGEETKTAFTLVYDEKIYDYNTQEFLDKYQNQGNLNIAIYNENKLLIYFGEKTENLSTKGDIFNTYSDAVYFQDVWLSFDKNVICILPEKKL